MQTEATRRARPARSRTQATRAGSSQAARTPGPPAITSVSTGVSSPGSGSATSRRPAEAVSTGSPAAITRGA